jgi:hypothetical protein
MTGKSFAIAALTIGYIVLGAFALIVVGFLKIAHSY